MGKIYVKAFGLALGIVCGGLIFGIGIFNMLFFWENLWVRMMPIVYIGYRPTVFGSIFAAARAFLYASLFGFALGWVYNRLVEDSLIEREKRIKELARKIWEKKGRPSGSEKADWNEAEKIINGK